MALKMQVKVFQVVMVCSVAASILTLKMEAARSSETFISFCSNTI
jgi:hypothetical protein